MIIPDNSTDISPNQNQIENKFNFQSIFFQFWSIIDANIIQLNNIESIQLTTSVNLSHGPLAWSSSFVQILLR